MSHILGFRVAGLGIKRSVNALEMIPKGDAVSCVAKIWETGGGQSGLGIKMY